MNKISVISLISIILLLTVYTDGYSRNLGDGKSNKNSEIISFPINVSSKEESNIKYIEINKDSDLEEKIEQIINVISNEYFNGLPINITVYKNIAKVELIEFNDERQSVVSWEKDYLNEKAKDYTINTIIKNIMQEQYKGEWIEKVQLYYEDDLIQLN